LAAYELALKCGIVVFLCLANFGVEFFKEVSFALMRTRFNDDAQRVPPVKALDGYWRDHLINMNWLRAAVSCQIYIFFLCLQSWLFVRKSSILLFVPYVLLVTGQCLEFWAPESLGGVQD
jgi:hypothetical protein